MSRANGSTATTSTVSKVNRTAIIETLKAHGPLSRAGIGELTGLSPATVNRLTGSLIKERLVEVEGQKESTGGRPPLIIRYTGRARLVAAIQLATDKATGILVDFDGEVVERHQAEFVAGEPGDPAAEGGAGGARLTATLGLLDALLAAAEAQGRPCLGVGVSVPGVVSGPDGIVNSIPELGWSKLPLGKILRERTSVPIFLENDANAMAYGELQRGAGQHTSNLVALLLGNGLGAGIVTDGVLHRGARSAAGEVGYMLMERSSLRRSYGELGDLEDRVGSQAVTREARNKGIHVPAGTLLTAHDILLLAAQGSEPAATELADGILDMISMAIAAMAIILDPEVIVVGSGLATNSDLIIPGVRERLDGRIFEVPDLVPPALGADAVIMGAAELAMNSVSGLTYLAHHGG